MVVREETEDGLVLVFSLTYRFARRAIADGLSAMAFLRDKSRATYVNDSAWLIELIKWIY
jgi:hypothetical protein